MWQRSTIQLLRFPFSFLLLPVYLFALSQALYTNWTDAVVVFFILHLLVFPASNGYNGYMDRDTGPVGGIRQPLPPTPALLKLVNAMDLLAVLLSLLVTPWFALGVLVYIAASRAYSSRKIRLKQYAWSGFLLVVLCQGALVFALVYHGVHLRHPAQVPLTGCIASSLLLGGAYPLTQVYQHRQDAADGVNTISRRLGIRGTFVFSAFLFNAAFLALGLHFGLQLELNRFGYLLLFFLPVGVYFFAWARKVWKNPAAADYDHLMRMNWISAICSNAGFLFILIWKLLD
ncbi:MAG: UbiA family prenyltransferase [Flavihumibacter sp.]